MQNSQDILFRHCKVEKADIQPKRVFIEAMQSQKTTTDGNGLLNIWEITSLQVLPTKRVFPV